MNTYRRHRFPPDIISYAVWLYYRFNLSHRDIEDLLAERGIIVTRESIRLWCIKSADVFLQAKRVVIAHAAVQNLFNLGRHPVKAKHYRDLRVSAFEEWSRAVA